jgi:beta-lactam-binding protein with PASTA domain
MMPTTPTPPTTPTRPDLHSPLPPMGARPGRLLPVLSIILVVLVCYLSFRWAIGAVIHSRPVVTVPDLNGKAVSDALTLLSQSRLGMIKEGEQFDKRFPAGTIVRQNPAPGMTVRESHMVKITLSQGGETLFVPNLGGQPFRNAQTQLQNVGLGIGEVERKPSLRFEKDQVMWTDPPGGAVVGKNALVNVTLSAGPPGSDVLLAPDFIGRTLSDAKRWATEHQIPLAVREESDISKPSGEILMQAPVGDSPLRPGDTLTIVANTGTGSNSSSPDGPHVHFQVPPGASDRDIRILVIDESGEREVYRRSGAPGSRVEFPVTTKGRARARILMNGVLAEEQDL